MKPLNILASAVRAKEILAILVRHGFGSLFEGVEIPARWRVPFLPAPAPRRTVWRRIRNVCEELGPTCVKFAQVLSTRPDLLPAPLLDELKTLRSEVRPAPNEHVIPMLEAELGGALEQFFTDWQATPVASGSLAQVYRAKLKSDGTPVAVKVQRPGIAKAIASDLDILDWLAEKLHDSIEELRPFDLPTIIEALRRGIQQELDFTLEARNAEHFNSINPDKAGIFAPRAHMDYTTKRVVVYDWVDGVPIYQARLENGEGQALAKIGGRSVLQQIFIAGYFHGDPHSGNILITPDKRLCIVDWGLTGQLTRRMRYFLADLFAGAASQNPEALVRTVCFMAEGSHRIDKTRLENDLALVLRRYPDFSSGDAAVGKLVIDLIGVLSRNGLHLTRDYTLLGKALLSIEEAARLLDPDFDIREVARPYLMELGRERQNPVNLLREVRRSLTTSLVTLNQFPTDLNRLMRRMEDGDLQLQLKLSGLERMRSALDRAAMHMVFGIIVGALIIGSSLVVASGKGPQLMGMPTLGLVGFVMAALLTLLLAYDAWRK